MPNITWTPGAFIAIIVFILAVIFAALGGDLKVFGLIALLALARLI